MSDQPEPTIPDRLKATDQTIGDLSDALGNVFVNIFHKLALFGIGAATVWAAVRAFVAMSYKGGAGIEDLLLLFIYLEIGAMVGIYFKTNHMPVRFLIYVGITAVTRHLIDIVNVEHQTGWPVLMLAGAILLLAVSVVVLRYASFHYPMNEARKPDPGFSVEND
jgi:phosphate starvation-inducible membrane PsiE